MRVLWAQETQSKARSLSQVGELAAPVSKLRNYSSWWGRNKHKLSFLSSQGDLF